MNDHTNLNRHIAKIHKGLRLFSIGRLLSRRLVASCGSAVPTIRRPELIGHPVLTKTTRVFSVIGLMPCWCTLHSLPTARRVDSRDRRGASWADVKYTQLRDK